MTEFERRYPGTAEKTAKCPKCGKGGKSIRTREGDNGLLEYRCGKCGEPWKGK
jgi:DNA-directed RNA polymerase subunit M/transcription elongation factor TFIIS